MDTNRGQTKLHGHKQGADKTKQSYKVYNATCRILGPYGITMKQNSITYMLFVFHPKYP